MPFCTGAMLSQEIAQMACGADRRLCVRWQQQQRVITALRHGYARGRASGPKPLMKMLHERALGFSPLTGAPCAGSTFIALPFKSMPCMPCTAACISDQQHLTMLNGS